MPSPDLPQTSVCEACVGEPAAPPPLDASKPFPYEVPLTAAGSGLRTEVQAGAFTIVLDAGKGLGGQESGPSPVQAFVSSIVACTQVRGVWGGQAERPFSRGQYHNTTTPYAGTP